MTAGADSRRRSAGSHRRMSAPRSPSPGTAPGLGARHRQPPAGTSSAPASAGVESPSAFPERAMRASLAGVARGGRSGRTAPVGGTAHGGATAHGGRIAPGGGVAHAGKTAPSSAVAGSRRLRRLAVGRQSSVAAPQSGSRLPGGAACRNRANPIAGTRTAGGSRRHRTLDRTDGISSARRPRRASLTAAGTNLTAAETSQNAAGGMMPTGAPGTAQSGGAEPAQCHGARAAARCLCTGMMRLH